MPSPGQPLHVASLHVHPVKSLRGVAVAAAEVDDLGLALDRRWMLVDDAGVFLTQREDAGMTLLRTELLAPPGDTADGTVTLAHRVRVHAPSGDTIDVAPPEPGSRRRRVRIWAHEVAACDYPAEVDAWFSEALGRQCHLMWLPDDSRRPIDDPHARADDRAAFSDAFPVLVALQASLDDLNARLAAQGHAPVAMERFRPNVVVAGDAEPYAEDGWREVTVGEVGLDLVKPCGRCVMTTVDPDTGRTGAEPLRTLSGYRKVDGKVRFAQNALVRNKGRVRVGNSVVLMGEAGA
ncbi:MOSC N-terminal beta barrel domain-containing protein [Roseisolibacter sp. H3M3-2]|uniref:MOSC domain-containing protein n=1 Tax=Roseisolibacter sp. H3M3-2 TaxID=3031323 RepID=UPI0023DC1F89|nr:MOSC N-terminal beta barrel domain-containing protein [Roseisolibacter sp. H3M3-2]MDF1505150.1 MOSC domain-containing protein [Roseisolibacter sp. H3M3-2]